MGEAILKLEGVCKSFGGVVTAKNVDLKVMPGEVHGLIGPNGAGKSTMMNLISGIYDVDHGSIFLMAGRSQKYLRIYGQEMGLEEPFRHPGFYTGQI